MNRKLNSSPPPFFFTKSVTQVGTTLNNRMINISQIELGYKKSKETWVKLNPKGKRTKYKKAVQRDMLSGPPKYGMTKKGCVKVGLPVKGVSNGSVGS